MATKINKKFDAAIVAASIAIATPVILLFEGTVQKAYLDPIGLVTACTGHTGPELRTGQVFTKEECDEMLSGDIAIASNGAQDCITTSVTPNELAAFTSFAFNAGVGAFCKSTMVKKLNAGDHAGACAELSRWTYAGGKVLPGLVRRRAAERALCEGRS